MILRRSGWLALLLLWPGAATTADRSARGDHPEKPETKPGVEIRREDGWELETITLPGPLLGYALPRTLQGRSLVALVAPPGRPALPIEEGNHSSPMGGPPPSAVDEEDAGDEGKDRGETVERQARRNLGPCADGDARPELYRVEGGRLERVAVDLPASATVVEVADTDGDGREELLVAYQGGLLRITDTGAETLLEDPRLSWVQRHPRAVSSPTLENHPVVPVSSMGELRVYGPDAGSRWAPRDRLELPIYGEVLGGHIEIRSPAPAVIGRNDSGSVFLATRPEPVGDWRLRSLLIELPSLGPAVVTESWMRFPEPEEMLESDFLFLDGRPVLFVTTKLADRLSLLGEKRVRVFPLLADRSRFGHDPLLALESQMNLWQAGAPTLRDVNGDGRVDLLLGYWKGLMDDKLVLDAYLRDEEGGFRTSPRTTAFDVDNADRGVLEFGPDVDGDGLADLVIRADGYVRVHQGLPSRSGKRLVKRECIPLSHLNGREPTETGNRRWDFVTGEPRPRFADVDDDGRDEILLVETGGDGGPGRIRVLGLADSTGSPAPGPSR